jgi:hypothetical integral membrane protein (TIGR02206 family)
MYFVTVAWCIVVMVALVAIGWVGRCRPWLRAAEIALGCAGLGLWLFKVAWFSLPLEELRPYVPLHLCNLTEVVCYLSLLTRWAMLRPLVYFWSLGALPAFITPEMTAGPESVAYWLFWIPHTLIVSIAVHEVIVHGYRPTLHDVGFVAAVTLLYLAIVFPFNIAFNSNYGYVGPSLPGAPSLIDFLGPWPLRVFWLGLLVLAVFVLAWLPWAILYRRKVV